MYSFNVRQSGMEIGGMGTSIQKNANGNKCLASMGMTMRMGLKLMRVGKIGKAESHPSPHTSAMQSRFEKMYNMLNTQCVNHQYNKETNNNYDCKQTN